MNPLLDADEGDLARRETPGDLAFPRHHSEQTEQALISRMCLECIHLCFICILIPLLFAYAHAYLLTILWDFFFLLKPKKNAE